jgi:hypothetical protein
MAKKIKYKLAGLEFTSDQAVVDHSKLIKSCYKRKEKITTPNHFNFLSDLLNRHVNKHDKIGDGIEYFFINLAPDHPETDCFWVRQKNGTETDFGIPACLKGILQLNKQSLREAIADQISEYRSKVINPQQTTFCSEFSGIKYPISEAVIDHVTPFDDIVSGFFKEKGIEIETVLLTHSVNASSKPIWKDQILINEFKEYHRKFQLRVVSKIENLSDIKRSLSRKHP